MNDFVRLSPKTVINLSAITWFLVEEKGTISISFIGGDTAEHDLYLRDEEAKKFLSIIESRMGI